jgi:hypothetical protein
MANTDYTKLLGDLGTDAEAGEVQFDSIIEQAIVRFVNGLSDTMKSNLTELDAYYADSELVQSIITLPLSSNGNSFEMSIEMNYYGDFLNQGVSGTRNKFNSPYSFKKESVSPAFNKSLRKWITKRGFPIESRYSQTRDLTKDQRKKKQIDEKTQMAYAMGIGIKREGIKPTNFINDALSEKNVAAFAQGLADALGRSIEITITKNILK